MLVLHGFLVIAACLVTIAILPAVAKAIYDQRQTGDVNVQIDLKDLQVIALVNSELLDDYTDYDYLYDYADFTIKPPGNRPIVSSTTEKNDATQVFEPLPSQNSTVSTPINNTSPTSDIMLSEGATPSNDTKNDKTLSKDEEIPNADPLIGTTSSTPNADNDDNKNQPSEKEAETGTTPSTTIKSAHVVRSQKRCKFGYVPNGNGRCRSWLNRLLP
ncbi:PREDICTED: uncharacterized protein LOC108685598 [Atta colombica]|uniref:uncharacterized protein LOC108685598 n=1 Tax=Atta colombica TaxID=520822 RepID=UPI00084BE705|nr:PREDICTED: uncharacterized protein LOC108685598 [Atta colombica]